MHVSNGGLCCVKASGQSPGAFVKAQTVREEDQSLDWMEHILVFRLEACGYKKLLSQEF